MPAKSKSKLTTQAKTKSESKPRSGSKHKSKSDSGKSSGGSGGERIEFIARGLIRAGDFVLLCRHVRRGYHYLPGGHVEFGEAASTALERELVEECGLRVRAGSLVLVTEERFNDGKVNRHEVNLVFHVEHRLGGRSEAGGAGSDGLGGVPVPVVSREPKIAFDWVELRRASAVDLRPETIKRWVVEVGAAGTDGAMPLTWIPGPGPGPARLRSRPRSVEAGVRASRGP